MNTMVETINILGKLGIPASVSGYEYIKEGVDILIHHEGYPRNAGFTKFLYPEIARRTGSTWQRVERAMRHSVSVGFNNSRASGFYEELFGNCINYDTGSVSLSQFLCIISERVKINCGYYDKQKWNVDGRKQGGGKKCVEKTHSYQR